MKSEIIEQAWTDTIFCCHPLIAEGFGGQRSGKSPPQCRADPRKSACARSQQSVRFDLMDECRAAGIDPMPIGSAWSIAPSLLADEQTTAPGPRQSW